MPQIVGLILDFVQNLNYATFSVEMLGFSQANRAAAPVTVWRRYASAWRSRKR